MNRLWRRCPPPEAITQATSEGESAALTQHMRDCVRCADLFQEGKELRSLLQNLRGQKPSAAKHQEAKNALLLAASRHAPRPRAARLLYGVAVAALFVGLAAYLLLPPPGQGAEATRRGVVYAGVSARFVHQGTPDDEIVRVTEGSITVEVEHLQPGERFRVVTGDAEVEVRGTAFEVSVHEDRLVSVRVLHGAVDVRPRRQPAVLLAPGERWLAPEKPEEAPAPTSTATSLPQSTPTSMSTTPASAPVLVTSKEAAVEKPRPLPATAPTIEEELYQSAFSSLRDGDFASAALSFREVARSSSDPGVAQDAAFWGAVALDRAKDPGAKSALAKFLSTYPDSPRVYEVRLLLGRILLAAGEIEKAREHLEEVAQNAPEALQRRAKEGLAAIEERSQPE